MAKAQAIPDLSADDSYGEAAAKVISTRAAELGEHARGVLDTGDIERVHDMRVATRRLRASMEVFEPCEVEAGDLHLLAQVAGQL